MSNSFGQLGEARVRVRISDTDPAEGWDAYASVLGLEVAESALKSLLALNPHLCVVIDGYGGEATE